MQNRSWLKIGRVLERGLKGKILRIGVAIVLLLIGGALYVKIFYPPRILGMAELDRYYHLAIARKVANEGFIRELPQVEDLGWGSSFSDPGYLFHQILSWGYRLNGDWGSLSIVPLIGIATILLIYGILSSYLSLPAAVLLTLFGTLMTPDFFFQLLLLQPDLLGIFFFVLLLAGILRRISWFIFLGSVGFELSCPAFYVPLIPLLALTFSKFQGREKRRVLLAGVGGVAFGVLTHPYFPSHLKEGWIDLKIALGFGVQEARPRGIQSPMFPPLSLLFSCCAFLGTWFWAAFHLRKEKMNSGKSSELFVLFATAGVFFLEAFMNHRAIIYGVPACILMAGVLFSEWQWSSKQWVFLSPLLLATLFQIKDVYSFYQRALTTPTQLPQAFEAISRIPAEASGKKIFNCRAATGAALIYQRPDVRFVDVLESDFLWERNPRLYEVKTEVKLGKAPDFFSVIRNTFGAEYVLCDHPGLRSQLENHPHVRKLGPEVDLNSGLQVLYGLVGAGDSE